MSKDEDLNQEKGEQASGINAFYLKALMSTLDADTYFTLPPQTIVSLDVVPKLKPDLLPETASATGSTSRSNTTILSVLDSCRTTSGRRLLALWLQNPLKCKKKIDLRLDIVQHFVENTEFRSICFDDYLKKIPDLLRIAFRVSKEKCTLNDLMKVYNSCKSGMSLCKSFQQVLNVSQKEAPEAVNKLIRWTSVSCVELADFMKLLEESIDVSGVDENGEYMVRPESDNDIAKLSLEINSLCNQAQRQLSYTADDIGLEAEKTIKLETDADKGFALKVTKNNESAVRGNSDYEQLSLVKKDGYRFTNRVLTKLSTKYVAAKDEYRSLARRVIEDVISKAVMYENEVLEFSMAVTLIDVFVALAVTAVQHNYVRPLILDLGAGRIHLEKLRHPCVENQPDTENYVPNDLSMSSDDRKFYMITGPNMGGKSTFIKSVGVSLIMAQCGSMIPVEDGRISVVDAIYTRVGAGDRQVEGISTFMEEMMDMSTILKNATENSVVLIDELGRGTSTFDGFGLAYSISKHLASQIQCYTLFATHFHELTEMEEEVPTVGNLHVKAVCHDDKLTMLYNIGQGVCNESYGINVAQYTKFPEHVVQAAKDKLKQFEEVPGFRSKKEVREFVRDCTRELMARKSN